MGTHAFFRLHPRRRGTRFMKNTCVPFLLALLGMTLPAAAKVPAEKAAELDGPALTCMGAEKAGSASGVAEYTGKFFGEWPGLKNKTGYDPGPYAAEKPLFTITAENM